MTDKKQDSSTDDLLLGIPFAEKDWQLIMTAVASLGLQEEKLHDRCMDVCALIVRTNLETFHSEKGKEALAHAREHGEAHVVNNGDKMHIIGADPRTLN